MINFLYKYLCTHVYIYIHIKAHLNFRVICFGKANEFSVWQMLSKICKKTSQFISSVDCDSY